MAVAEAKPKLVSKVFRATLEQIPGRLLWTIIYVPLDVEKTWGVRGQFKVRGEINGFAFRTSLFPLSKRPVSTAANDEGSERAAAAEVRKRAPANATHMMLVNKQMQREAAVRPGTTAEFCLEPDTEERVVTIPPELTRVLKQSKQLAKYYESFSYSYRKYMAEWIAEPKSEQSRRRRAEDIAERLMLTYEGEREPPPVLQQAFAHNPLARRGWELMPRGHKRSHLMALYGYKSPESRARRLAKAVQEMVAYAEKRNAKAARP
jgi:uncharacterized protein YdeI (YjbR/CyaY-like superfamily)